MTELDTIDSETLAAAIKEAIADAAEKVAVAITAHALHVAPGGHNRRQAAQQPPTAPHATPTVYDAPGGLKESVETRWHAIRDVFDDHAYRGSSYAACTCDWTHPGVTDPRGEWHDHMTDVINGRIADLKLEVRS